MKSKIIGKNTSQIEVVNISQHGFWIHIHGNEYFLSYEDFPWFRNATVDDILKVQLEHEDHLHWPSLDVDLELDSVRSPSNHPLVYQQVEEQR